MSRACFFDGRTRTVSSARCIHGTPSDAAESFREETLGSCPGAQSGRAEEMRRVDHSGGRLAIFRSYYAERLARPDLRLTSPSESTTIALLARLSGLIEPLREFTKTKPVWGTCAGAILLSQAVSNPKKGGQELLGGVSVKIARNGWGSQARRLHLLSTHKPALTFFFFLRGSLFRRLNLSRFRLR
jgi:glutamine amidotransferase PdxT